ncbi:DNA cytosine methyltransferase [Litorivicinus sp.]|nr:DNA cytosine methyltransferase [Litorivicinus sp.]
MNVLSLFSGIGVAEAFFKREKINVCVANEKDDRRANVFKRIYPHVSVVPGDIRDKTVMDEIVRLSILNGVDTIIATPPCQGMSRAAGRPVPGDSRNDLITTVFDLIRKLNPKHVFIENVKRLFEIQICYGSQPATVHQLLFQLFGQNYQIEAQVIDTKDFGIPQSRVRAIVLMTRKEESKVLRIPSPTKSVKTLFDAIGHLPSLDPFVKDIPDEMSELLFPDFEEKKEIALEISRWHHPPEHIYRQVLAMMHTPTGKTAFENEVFYPKTATGERVRGYLSTYRRLRWDAPCSTVTMDNRKISSQNNVHPGRLISSDAEISRYSDPRCLTTYELMQVMTLPDDWPVPENTPEAFLRSVIGEGIPPQFMIQVLKSVLKS